MQKYLLFFVLTINLNQIWMDDEFNWALYGIPQLVRSSLNESVVVADDDLANAKYL